MKNRILTIKKLCYNEEKKIYNNSQIIFISFF